MDALCLHGAAGLARRIAGRHLRSRAARPRLGLAALPPHYATPAPPRHRHGGDPAHHGGADGVRRDLHRHRRGSRHGDRDPQSLCLPEILYRAVDRLRLGACGGAARRHHPDLGRPVRAAEGEMSGKRIRTIAVLAISFAFLLAWAFPILWSVLNSFKTDQDVLAYPPKVLFAPTLEAYRDVLFGSA